MKRNFRRTLSILLSAAMLLSVMSLTALADGPADAGAPGAGEGGGPGGPGGQGTSASIDLTGMLSLKQYVFVRSQNEISNGSVSTDCYGVYAKGTGDSEAAYVPAAFTGSIAVYTDSELTQAAQGVTASLTGSTLTVSGVATEGNVAYYLSTGEGAYPTTLYVVNDEYDADSATLTLADGTKVELTTYAPNMANGDYTATVEAVNEDGAVYIGGNRTILTAADYGITGEDAEAVDWFLSSGITNAGDSLTEFGDTMYGFEYAVAIYRMFQIVCEETLLVNGFAYPTDSVGGMGVNDQYSDAVDATLQTGIWNGIYTTYSTEKMNSTNELYLLEKLPTAGDTLGCTVPVDVEFAYVGLFNALTSNWTMLNAAGEAMSSALLAAAASVDGSTKTAPDDYTNAAKIYAVAKEVLKLDDQAAKAVSGDDAMSKIDVVSLLYAVSNCVKSKESPDESWSAQTGSSNSNMVQYFSQAQKVTAANYASANFNNVSSLLSAEGTGLLVNNIGGTLTITNSPISIVANYAGDYEPITKTIDADTMVDGMEAAMGTQTEGFVYNATARNAYYREAIGSGAAFWGADTIVNLRSDNGTLVLSGTNSGSMAGTAYVGFGASLNITNAVAYSAGQHLSNNLYNGTIHYKDAAAFSSGRVFSSDFWGGYQVFEDTIAEGGNVTDEPTTLIVKNSVYGNSIGGNGFASQYFENSILNVGGATFHNTTSLITDTGSLTLVNSQVNSTGSTFLTSDKGERVILTLVDSDISMPGGNSLVEVHNGSTVNNPRDEFATSLYNGEVAVYLYGDNTITTSNGTLSAVVQDGASLTIYGNVVDADGNAISLPGANIVTGSQYGTLTVLGGSDTPAFSDVSESNWFYEAVSFAVEEGLFNGTSDTTFEPQTKMSRAMLATVLYRLADQPEVTADSTFSDVAAGKWYTDAVVWASDNAIVNGYGSGLFGTNDNVTRQEMVTMLYRYAKLMGSDVTASTSLDAFPDAGSVASWASEAMQWAVAIGLIQGNDGSLNPTATATRAEVATILMRFCQL